MVLDAAAMLLYAQRRDYVYAIITLLLMASKIFTSCLFTAYCHISYAITAASPRLHDGARA